ncbi:hypothetical protein AALP_AA3G197100 [Arabis alpina]|uniref:Phospholipid scramblase n=1 Tax=Arabis alpina TaxID=50452 RepID=A0A087HAC0_ARAAL|nr:hypothetical protein AALP_AA3G197100 [Arabis alpina]
MFCLSRRSSSALLRSAFQLRGDATASVSCSTLFSNPEGIGVVNSGNHSLAFRNSSLCTSQVSLPSSRCFSDGSGDTSPRLDRKFLAQLWISDMKMLKAMEKRYGKASKHRNCPEDDDDNQSSLAQPNGRSLSGTSTKENDYEPTVKQPPVSQSMSGPLKPTTSDEVKIANLLARSNLLITRDIEWANLVLGIEQENRYCVVDVCYPQAPVGSIREKSNLLARQLLRIRRPFVASITDALGNELFRVRRPFWWITSSIYAEIDGEEIGVVHQRWHLWRRIYDLYLGNQQFAVVENPGFWDWTFTVKDADGEVLAQIDRDWRGFGFEIFTDAGQYVIRFGKSDAASKTGPAKMVEELEVKRPLTLSERAVALALAISLDNDYFSRHGGWGIPFMAVGE